jgi:hypothetical protein
MATIPLELYELFEKRLGKEEAKKAAELIKRSLEVIEERAKEQKKVVKAELKDELRKELATKEDIVLLDQKIETHYRELDQKVETVYRELNQKIETVRQEIKLSEERVKRWLLLIVFLIVFLNQNTVMFLLKFAGLIK